MRREKKEASVIPIPRIPRDENGRPIFPVRLNNGFCIIDLGHIVTDRANFHTEKLIYRAGFKSSRLYASALDPSQRVRYTSEIVDIGDELPLFRVTMDDHPDIYFEGPTLSSPWNSLAKRIQEARGDAGPRMTTLEGLKYFGLHHPAICYLIQQMDGADKCEKYVMTPFASPRVLAKQKHKHRYIVAAQIADEEQHATRKWKRTSARETKERAQRLKENLPQRDPTGKWTAEEEEIILRLHKPNHSDWATVVAALPGRTIKAAMRQWKTIQRQNRKEAEYHDDEGAPP
jgi:hypothetical protein